MSLTRDPRLSLVLVPPYFSLLSIEIDNEGTGPVSIYIGTKIIKAFPLDRAAYNIYRGWELPADEDGSDKGYLVEYIDGGAPNDPRHEGYISWSPAEVFEKAYHPTNQMTFSEALIALKRDFCITRSGWNGRGMYLYLVPENIRFPQTNIDHSIAQDQPDGLVYSDAFIAMKTAQNTVVPWLASQTDLLADDWMIVELSNR